VNGINSRWRASLMATILVGVACALTLAGCVTVPSWNAGVTAASKVIEDAGKQVDQYQKIGAIDNATEDKLLDRLKGANAELRRADQLHALCGVSNCKTPSDILAAVNAVVAEVTTELLRLAAKDTRP
jgi:hypothetical protein